MLLLVSVPGAGLFAQGVRITGASTARYLELRPLVGDSVLESAAIDTTGIDRRLADGTIVRCLGDGFCRYLRAGGTTQLTALMQDVDATAWGFGRGVSARAQLRFREAAGDGRSLWPQARQQLDVMSLYAELDRDRLRARLGRQWHASELGYRNFDGALVEAQPVRGLVGLRIEGFAGWSLVQGLNRSLTSDALAAVEELPPDDRGVLLGAALRWRPASGLGAARLSYEREIRQDRGALYEERAAASADVRVYGVGLAGSAVYDLSTASFNELRLSASRDVVRTLAVTVEGRHHTPFFPLWTIWGAFAPVGFNEGRVDARWSPMGARLSVTGSGSYRRYEDTHTGVASLPLRNDGWRLGGTVAFTLTEAWAVQGGYGADVGSGAARTDGDVAVRWRRGDRFSVAARGAGFETISEYRTGTGRVLGAGGEMAFALRPDLYLAADAMVYRQRRNGRTTEGPWNQRRATVRLEWSLGGDPGAAPRERVPGTRGTP